jgi:hypothetical protein
VFSESLTGGPRQWRKHAHIRCYFRLGGFVRCGAGVEGPRPDIDQPLSTIAEGKYAETMPQELSLGCAGRQMPPASLTANRAAGVAARMLDNSPIRNIDTF